MNDSKTKPPDFDKVRCSLCQRHCSKETSIKSLSRVIDSLTKVMNENLWGEVTIRFKDGKPVLMTTISQAKIDS